MSGETQSRRTNFLGLLRLAFFGMALTATSQAQAPKEECVVCHGEQLSALQQSVHALAGVSCVTCHGGNPSASGKAEAHTDQLRSDIGGRAAVDLCSGCHSDVELMRRYALRTDQLALYKTSGHGVRLFEQNDPSVATCVSCHGAHEIRPVRDPLSTVHKINLVSTCGHCHADATLMGRYGRSSDIPELFTKSVHGKALLQDRNLASPGCADCHGSHGAQPPRTEDIGTVCGHCHSVIREFFEQSPHFAAAKQGIMKECITCHSNHDVQTPGPELFVGDGERHCGSCHSGGDDPGAKTAQALHDVPSKLAADIKDTEQRLIQASAVGIFIEDEQGYVDEARAMLVRARSLTHTVSEQRVADLANRGQAMVHETLESLEVKARGLRDRKILVSGFALIVLVFIGILLIRRREV